MWRGGGFAQKTRRHLDNGDLGSCLIGGVVNDWCDHAGAVASNPGFFTR